VIGDDHRRRTAGERRRAAYFQPYREDRKQTRRPALYIADPPRGAEERKNQACGRDGMREMQCKPGKTKQPGDEICRFNGRTQS
jgi:hypothetical protein